MTDKFKKSPIRVREYAERIKALKIGELDEKTKSDILKLHMVGFEDGITDTDQTDALQFNFFSFSRKIKEQIYADGQAAGIEVWRNEVNKIRELLDFRLTTEIND